MAAGVQLSYHLGKQLAVDHSSHPLDHSVECWKAWQFIGVTAQLLHRHINEIGRLRHHPGRLRNGIDGQTTCGVAVSWLQSEVGPDRARSCRRRVRGGGMRGSRWAGKRKHTRTWLTMVEGIALRAGK